MWTITSKELQSLQEIYLEGVFLSLPINHHITSFWHVCVRMCYWERTFGGLDS